MDPVSSPRLDDHFEALAHVERRRLLFALLESGRRDVPVDAGDRPGGDDPGRLVALRHAHLPKLADLGYVTWDRETGRVARGPQFEAIRPLLELLVEHREELPGELA